MSKIAIVYWSGTGNTEAMAHLIEEGVKSAGGEASLITASAFSAEQVKEYDGIAFGCPSMGAEELEDGEFEPMFSAVKGELAGKRIALFGSYGWGDGEWMRNWEADCSSAGIQLVCDPVITGGAPEGEAVDACRGLGAAVAK